MNVWKIEVKKKKIRFTSDVDEVRHKNNNCIREINIYDEIIIIRRRRLIRYLTYPLPLPIIYVFFLQKQKDVSITLRTVSGRMSHTVLITLYTYWYKPRVCDRYKNSARILPP